MTRRTLTWLRKFWEFYASVAGLAMVSLAVGYGVVVALSPNASQPVAEIIAGSVVSPKSVPYLGRLTYTSDIQRNASCPGYVVYTLVSQTNHGPPAIVVFRRPVAAVEIKFYDNVPVNLPLPESVFPGKWLFQASLDSRCPTFERSDPLAAFEFEVTPT